VERSVYFFTYVFVLSTVDKIYNPLSLTEKEITSAVNVELQNWSCFAEMCLLCDVFVPPASQFAFNY